MAGDGTTETDALRSSREALERHEAYEQLRSLLGTEPDADDVPRRREEPSDKPQMD